MSMRYYPLALFMVHHWRYWSW